MTVSTTITPTSRQYSCSLQALRSGRKLQRHHDAPPPAIAHATSPAPAIHGPRNVGGTPGRPFGFLIPATGEKPLHFVAKNLPEGLALDAETGIISGALNLSGTTIVGRRGSNAHGKREARSTAIVGGPHKLALTPPMGLELLELLGQCRQRRQGPRRGRCDGHQRACGPRLPICEHR